MKFKWRDLQTGEKKEHDTVRQMRLTHRRDPEYLSEQLAVTVRRIGYWAGQRRLAEIESSRLGKSVSSILSRMYFRAYLKVKKHPMLNERDHQMVESFYSIIPKVKKARASVLRAESRIKTATMMLSLMRDRKYAIEALLKRASDS